MLIIPTWPMKNVHVPLPWVVCYSILHFSSLKMGKLTFTERPLPECADLWLLLDVLITVRCTELQSFPLSELLSPEEGKPLGEPLGILGALCHQHCLPHPMACQAQASPIHLTSPSDAPLSRPCIQSSTLQVPAKDQMALPDPWGHPSPLTFIFFSMTASTLAQWPFCTIFGVASTFPVLPAQLTGPVKLNPKSLAIV